MITNVQSRIDTCVIYFRNKLLLSLFVQEILVVFQCTCDYVGAMCAKCVHHSTIKYVPDVTLCVAWHIAHNTPHIDKIKYVCYRKVNTNHCSCGRPICAIFCHVSLALVFVWFKLEIQIKSTSLQSNSFHFIILLAFIFAACCHSPDGCW